MKVLPTMGSMYSGSLAGITASHNKGGLYFRGRTVPTNPNTARQQALRAIVGGLMQTWGNTLTEAQRQGWRDYAANVPVTDSLGQAMNLSGINWFVKVNSAVAQAVDAGLSPLTNIPAVTDVPTIFTTGESVQGVSTFEGVFTVSPGTITVSGSLTGLAPDDGIILLYIGAPQSNGVRFYKGPYQLAAATNFVATDFSYAFTDVDLSMADEWVTDTTPIAAWDTLFVPVKLVTLYDDARRGQDFAALVQFADATP